MHIYRERLFKPTLIALTSNMQLPMGVFGAGYDMNTFSLVKCSFYPWFLCLKKKKGNALSSVCLLYSAYSTTAGKLQTEEKVSLSLQISNA